MMEVKVSVCPRQPTGFLDLPFEVRLQIYRYCLVRRTTIHGNRIHLSGDKNKSLLLVSKRIGSEALDVLYGDNVFTVSALRGGEWYFNKHFTEANRQRIRKVQLLMEPPPNEDDCILDSTVWSPVLANLKELSIVALQPLPLSLALDFQLWDKWISWLRSMLQYIACHLPRSCVVELDDNDRYRFGIRAVTSECLPIEYQCVQSLTGDYYFMRNDYSIESGYCDQQ